MRLRRPLAVALAAFSASCGDFAGPATQHNVKPDASVVASAPTVTTGAADRLTKQQTNGSIRVAGSAVPNGAATDVWFEFGTNPDLSGASTTTVRAIGAGATPVVDRDTLLFPYQLGVTIYYRIVASNSAGTSYGNIASVVFDVPPALTNLSADLTAQHGVLLTFDNPNIRTTRIVLLRMYSNAGWDYVTTTLAPDATAFIDDAFNVRKDSIWYAARACNSLGCSADATFLMTGASLPAPGNLHADDTTPGHVVIGWDDNSTTEQSFVITRTDVHGARATWRVAANTTSFTDTAPGEGLQYWYTVRARLSAGRTSEESNVLSVVPGGGPPAAPAAVTAGVDSFWVANFAGSGLITVNGSATGNGAATTIWFQFSKNADFSASMTSGARSIGAGTVPTAVHDTLIFGYQNGVTIYYRMVASNSVATTYGATESFLYGTPAVPNNFVGTLTANHSMLLTFETVASLHSKLSITRKYPLGAWESIASGLPGGATEYTDATFDVHQDSISWSVLACNPLGCVGRTVVVHGTLLQHPGNLRFITTTPGNTQIAWDEASTTEQSFQIRRTDGNGNVVDRLVPANTTSFTDTTTVGGMTYSYRVRALVSPTRRSRFSNTITL